MPVQPKNLINQDLVKIRQYLPVKLAELSRFDEIAAIGILRDWGEGRKPLRDLWKNTSDLLDAATSNKSKKIT